MDSNRIRKLAEGARTALMTEVSASLDRVLLPESAERISFPSQVAKIEHAVKGEGRDDLIERVAYTWFNRLCALRFMDVKGYTSTPCVSSRPGESMPAILADARRGIFDQELVSSEATRAQVRGLIGGTVTSDNPLGEAFVALLLSACEVFAAPMGYLFGGSLETKATLTLLAPTDLLSEDSVLHRIYEGMDEDGCQDVEVLGWLYQYYIAERKDEVFAGFKKNRKAGPDEIKPATQLFTPSWIVRYMVENSLGRLWMLNFPDSALRAQMDYYIEPEEPETDFVRIHSPEDITFCDPACGSGHILVYAFGLLFEMYREEGYRSSDIPALILEKNLSGFEIDTRAAEIAAFALEMKAREKDPAFFEKGVDARITVLDPVRFDGDELAAAGLLVGQADLLGAFDHLDEVGSLYVPEASDRVLVEDAISNLKERGGMFAAATLEKLERVEETLDTLSQRFDVVVANPPYMGSKNMNAWLSGWLKDRYPNEKSDLFAAFFVRLTLLTKDNGQIGMMTPYVWMFISSYEKMRKLLIDQKTITSLVQLEYSGFSGATVPICTFTFANKHYLNYRGGYIRLSDFVGADSQAPKTLEAIHNPECGWFYRCDADSFKDIPGSPIAYWASDAAILDFKILPSLEKIAKPRQGLVTGDNERFLRCWWEIPVNRIGFGFKNRTEAAESHMGWFPCHKGGEYRKWYGNNVFVVNWENDGAEIRSFEKNGRLASRPQNIDFYFKEGLTWSALTSGSFSMRFSPAGFISEHKGTMCFSSSTEEHLRCLGAMNSSSAQASLEALCPTLDFGEGAVGKVPIAIDDSDETVKYVQCNIAISRNDWNSFETSWDFKKHPLI